jgi:hypothetical protein
MHHAILSPRRRPLSLSGGGGGRSVGLGVCLMRNARERGVRAAPSRQVRPGLICLGNSAADRSATV